MAPLQELPTNFIDIAIGDSIRAGTTAEADNTNNTDTAEATQTTAGWTSDKPRTDASPSAGFELPANVGDDEYERKLAQCRAAYRPTNMIHEMLVATIAAQTIRLDWLRK